ncbi:MAG: phosphotransferase [Woeseiaceae bacterium]
MNASVAEVLAGITGWEDAAYTDLSGGLTNTSWLVDSGDRKAVLKIDDDPRSVPFNARPTEAQIQTRAVNQGLANNVIYVSDTVLMTEFVDGKVWTTKCLQADENLEKLAAAMKQLHALPLTGRTFDAIGAARNYAHRIRARGCDSVEVRDCLARIEAMPLPQNLCCCHNDLVVANIIYMPEIRFLDWEYACDNDPFFDIATVVAHHQLPPERAEYLLNAYFDGEGARWSEQLSRQTEFYDALHWLWEASRSPTVA